MNQAKITIPYAVANYAEIRERGFYYVDKTMFIPDLESYKAPVFLRPCRFGKSLMVSMLAHMLEDVLHYVRENHLPPLYILIDEYDNFTNQLLTAYKDPLYESVTTADSFLRTFFKVIKVGIGEGSIRTCFCTGVLPVTVRLSTQMIALLSLSTSRQQRRRRFLPSKLPARTMPSKSETMLTPSASSFPTSLCVLT